VLCPPPFSHDFSGFPKPYSIDGRLLFSSSNPPFAQPFTGSSAFLSVGIVFCLSPSPAPNARRARRRPFQYEIERQQRRHGLISQRGHVNFLSSLDDRIRLMLLLSAALLCKVIYLFPLVVVRAPDALQIFPSESRSALRSPMRAPGMRSWEEVNPFFFSVGQSGNLRLTGCNLE